MPTVILLDVSMSMSRRTIGVDGRKTDTQLKQLAEHGILFFLDELVERCKLEFSALVIFSSLWEIVIPFTRDFSALKAGCLDLDVYDKTRIENALHGVQNLVMEEWGGFVPINLILVTDGRVGTGSCSLKESLRKQKASESDFPLPFNFPCNLSVVCLSDSRFDENFTENMNCYKELINLNNNNGEIYIPEIPLTELHIEHVFKKIIQLHYEGYEGLLTCGNLKSSITLSPSPSFKSSWLSLLNLYRPEKKNLSQLKIPNEIKTVGFLDIADISNPPYISRHVVIPVPKQNQDLENGCKVTQVTATDDDARNPSFCVLLHGSLKIEKMVAIVQLG